MENPKTIKQYINPNINVGDMVLINDGSYLTSETLPNTWFLIISSYPEILGTDEKLKHILGKVVSTGLTTNINTSIISGQVQQDIQVNINGVVFNTCSGCVRKFESINDAIKYIRESKAYDETKMIEGYYDDYFYNGNE